MTIAQDGYVHEEEYNENKGLVKVCHVTKLKHRAKKDFDKKNGVSEKNIRCPLVDNMRQKGHA